MPGTYEAIATTTLSSAATSISFSNIPSTYTDLVIIGRYALDFTGTPAIGTINSSSNAILSVTAMYSSGSGSSSYKVNNSTSTQLKTIDTDFATQATLRLNIMSYSNTTTFKTILAECANGSGEVSRSAIVWRSTSAINEFSVARLGSCQYVTGSIFTLYGIKAA